MNDYDDEWPKTGTPAHNESQPRGIHIADDAPLDSKYPSYIPNPNCKTCKGEGKIYFQVNHYNKYGNAEFVDVEAEPCKCIFEYMKVVADKRCIMCNGTGEVQETHLNDSNERVITHHSCLCLRHVPNEPPNEGEENNV